MSDEPYKVPDGCSVDIELDTEGGVQNTVIRIRREDGSVQAPKRRERAAQS
jgi:hypothetical protein